MVPYGMTWPVDNFRPFGLVTILGMLTIRGISGCALGFDFDSFTYLETAGSASETL